MAQKKRLKGDLGEEFLEVANRISAVLKEAKIHGKSDYSIEYL